MAAVIIYLKNIYPLRTAEELCKKSYKHKLYVLYMTLQISGIMLLHCLNIGDHIWPYLHTVSDSGLYSG